MTKKISNFLIILCVFNLPIFAASCSEKSCVSDGYSEYYGQVLPITTVYAELENAVNATRNQYEEYDEVLKEQNKILDNIISVQKATALNMKEIVFLLKKIASLKNVNIDIQTQNAINIFYKKHLLKIEKKGKL